MCEVLEGGAYGGGCREGDEGAWVGDGWGQEGVSCGGECETIIIDVGMFGFTISQLNLLLPPGHVASPRDLRNCLPQVLLAVYRDYVMNKYYSISAPSNSNEQEQQRTVCL